MEQLKSKRKRLDPALSRKIIDAIGGTTAVARVCGITQPSVSEWKAIGITRPYLLFLRERYSTLPVMRLDKVLDF